MGGVSFTQNKAKANRGIKVKVFIRPLTLTLTLTLLYFLFFLFFGLSIFISQNKVNFFLRNNKVKNLVTHNFPQLFDITMM